ncbi:MAG: metal-dependent hydrolase, partial [Mycobacterium sp.]|nr:metal-dependent hydrolase [Mycobacterium sp.]
YEESEHRSVAFDVYQAIGGSERRRTTTMRLLCVVLLALTLVSVTGSLLCDRAAYHPIRLLRSFATQRDNVIIQGNAERLRAYLRPGFHPDDVDNTELLERWGAELFGERGELADHMRHGSG